MKTLSSPDDLLTGPDNPMPVSLEQATRLALDDYESRLKPILEPAHNGQVVALHSESGDYAVADTAGRARKAIRTRHPQGYLLLHTIGPVEDLGLALRMMGSRLVSSLETHP